MALGPMALRGVRVLDLSILFPGPLCAALLRDFGADVVKLEGPEGDPLRQTGEMWLGEDGATRFYIYGFCNRNKRGVQADLATEAGRAVLHRLAAAADVIVVNQLMPLLERWGISWAQVSARHPRAIMVSLSGYGVTGPYAGRAGAGTMAEAFAGLQHMIGEPDGKPLPPSFPLGDAVTAIQAFTGALLALYWRDANAGKGQFVDVAFYEALLPLIGSVAVAWSPGKPVPMRSGGRMPGSSPRNVYRSADGHYIALVATADNQAARVLHLIGQDTEANRTRFGHSAGRLEHGDELDCMVADWFARHSQRDAMSQLLAARVPAAEVNDLASLRADPHVQARGSLAVLDDPVIGPSEIPAPTPLLGATPGAFHRPAPAVGEHTDEVLRDWTSP